MRTPRSCPSAGGLSGLDLVRLGPGNDLIVVLAGEVRIFERYGQPGETVITAHGPSQFVGEIGLLTGQRAYLSAVASSGGRVLRVPVEGVRVLMAQEPSLSELTLRRFLVRHPFSPAWARA